ncbi:phage holin family protein [Nocardiopsis quinghaiensis]|uniref:phage holin family protein n=1 Tax=Nocardiopsis quinghaiensis TaxID=464995 RepID=UPI001239DB06|nr:phage holin family protein [Nocardiopsis quinghaiensis]
MPPGQFGGPPPPPPPKPRRLGLFSSPSGLRAALLNASGTGAGYVYLRQWPFFAGALIITVGLLVTAAIMGAADNVLLWAAVFAAWFVVAAVLGLFAGRSRDERVLNRGEQPSKGATPLLVAAGLVVVLLVSLTGVWQAGEWRLRVADAAHARGECGGSEAVAAYGSVENLFQLSFSPSLMQRARAGAEACALLERAQVEVSAEEYEQALNSYGSYFAHPASRWEDTDGEVADIHLSYAANLVSVAEEGFNGEVTEDYRESMRRAHEVYSVIPVDYEGTEAAGNVPTALSELYETGTSQYAAENWCAGFDQVEMFSDLVWDTVPEVAERIVSERPDAALKCGWEHVGEGRFAPAEDMVDLLEEEYPDHEADDVEKMVVHIGAGRIESEMDTLTAIGEVDFAPAPTGGSGNDKAVLEITNNSPYEMRFLYVGPDKVHEEILTPACEDCEAYSSPPTGNSCFDKGEVMKVEFEPGEYRVLLTSNDSLFAAPLHGNVDFGAGDKYESCYYITEE